MWQLSASFQTIETTKPSYFYEGFVLYGAAPGVESDDNVLFFLRFLYCHGECYLKIYPFESRALHIKCLAVRLEYYLERMKLYVGL
jgi:hypothetical protein